MRIIIVFILFVTNIILSSFPSLAGGFDYYFRNMVVEDGLSQNMVYSIMQDKTGFMWFGTLDGLNRYDGLEFKVFKKDNDDKNYHSIGSNKIFSLLQTNDDNIWIGTSNGIYIYNPLMETFSRFNTSTVGREEVGGIIRDLKLDKDGEIWIAVQNKGVFCYTNKKELIHFPLNEANVRKIEFDLEGKVWLATHGAGLIKLDPISHKFESFLIDSKMNKNPININTILSYNSSYLLVGTTNKGVQKFDLNEKKYTPVIEKGFDGDQLFVRSMIKTENHEVWIGTEKGIYILDLRTMAFVNLKHTYNDPYSLSDNAIHSIYQDREGGIWIGTFFGGINYFNTSFSRFDKYYPNVGRNSISGKSISEFCEDNLKNIWIGTEDAGLNKFNPDTKAFSKGPIASENIHSLLYEDGMLWVGTFSDGLYVIDLQTQKVSSYRNTSSTDSPKDDNIYSLFKDSSGIIWIGSMTGLQYYDKLSDKFARVNEEKINCQVNDILEDHKGVLWFATIGDGIFSYNRFENNWQHYLSTLDLPCDDTGKTVICLLQDKKNRLWAGTEGAGLSMFNSETSSFSIVANSNTGLPNDVIYKLIEDSKGFIWGSTNKGIFRFNPETMKIDIFTHSNGLLGDQFNYKSGLRDSLGKIYFGGVKGFVVFDPENFNVNEYIPNIVIKSFQIHNREVSLTEKNSPLSNSIIYTSSIEIPYNTSVFSIGFVALSYLHPNGNKYAYKLEGRDSEWSYIDKAHQINYTDLSPGSYVFLVKGSNSDGVWNEVATSLIIKVGSPWYRTSWAYSFYLVFISALIYFSIVYFIRKSQRQNAQLLKELENRKEKELYSAKIDFFTHITHEIRTPLSLIKIPFEDIMRDVDKGDLNWNNYSIIQRNVNRLLKLVNELLDFRKTEAQGLRLNFVKTDVVFIVKDVIERFRPSFESKGVEFNLNCEVDSLLVDVDREVFIRILSNLLSNALKYSFKIIEFEFSFSQDTFIISISNDGDKIPDQYVERIFEPLFKLNNNIQGTGIGLAFVKALIELHKGTIYCDNSSDNRTTFVITLPLSQDYTINMDNGEKENNAHDGPLSLSQLESVLSKRSNHTILTVEDSEDFQELLKRHLKRKYHVLQSKNGLEAMGVMDKENVDLVVCDIMMPVMSGLEFCKAMKENLKYSHIPIILLTAKTNMESKIEGMNCGADGYIEKPYSVDYLVAQIDNLLESRRKMQETFKSSPELAFKSITHTKADEEFLEKLITVIHENIDDPDLNIDKLAGEMAQSRSSLYRKLKNVSELTPNDFILLVRLKKAAELIKQKQYQINEIAFMVGFNSPNYFSKCFFKQFGILPKDF